MLSRFALSTTKNTQIVNSLSKRYLSFEKTHDGNTINVVVNKKEYAIWKKYAMGFKIMFPIIFGLQMLEDGVVYKIHVDDCIETMHYIPVFIPSVLFENFIKTSFLTFALAIVWPGSLFGTLRQTFHLIDYFNGDSTQLQKRFPNSDLWRAFDWVDYDKVIRRFDGTVSPFKIFPLMWALSKKAKVQMNVKEDDHDLYWD